MRALVTAFEAFGGARANASSAAVTRLPARIGALDIVTAQLPTSYARSGAALIREIERVKPTLVLCVGEAGERHELNVERVAINVQDARLADNDGAQPIDVPVLKDAPAAYFATLPVRAIHDASDRRTFAGDSLEQRRHVRVQSRVLYADAFRGDYEVKNKRRISSRTRVARGQHRTGNDTRRYRARHYDRA